MHHAHILLFGGDGMTGARAWRMLFVAAALFNFIMGVPIMLLTSWAFGLVFNGADTAGLIASKLWGDFGFCVVLIGVGYLMVAFDLRNRAIVWLGIGAKGFDVIVLSSRWLTGITKPVVLLPAVIDALFIVGFVLFLLQRRDKPLHA